MNLPSDNPMLSGPEAEAVLALLEADASVLQAARSRGMSPDDLLSLLSRPAAQEALESLRAVAALRHELRSEAIREELVAILRDVARAAPDPAEKRRAATTALGALRPARSAAALRSRPATSPAPFMPARHAVIHAPHTTTRHVSGRASGPSGVPPGAISTPSSTNPGAGGAPTSAPAAPTPEPTVHGAPATPPGAAERGTTPAIPGRGFQGGGAAMERSHNPVRPAALAEPDPRVAELVSSLLAEEQAREVLDDVLLDEDLDEEPDDVLDDDPHEHPGFDDAGESDDVLALARRVIADPASYPPEALQAARVLTGPHESSTPARPP